MARSCGDKEMTQWLRELTENLGLSLSVCMGVITECNSSSRASSTLFWHQTLVWYIDIYMQEENLYIFLKNQTKFSSPNTWKVEAGGLCIQGHSWLHILVQG